MVPAAAEAFLSPIVCQKSLSSQRWQAMSWWVLPGVEGRIKFVGKSPMTFQGEKRKAARNADFKKKIILDLILNYWFTFLIGYFLPQREWRAYWMTLFLPLCYCYGCSFFHKPKAEGFIAKFIFTQDKREKLKPRQYCRKYASLNTLSVKVVSGLRLRGFVSGNAAKSERV